MIGWYKRYSRDAYLRGRRDNAMNDHNFMLNTAFNENSKEYQTRPVRAAKYQPGMENSFAVCFSNFSDEGFRFFDDLESAMQFYEEKPAQNKYVNGKIEAVKCYYYEPAPVLFRKKTDEERKYEESEGFVSQNSFCDNEIDDYEVYFLYDNSWIIQELDGSIRVWYPDSEETFFGEDIYEKVTGQEDYIRVTI